MFIALYQSGRFQISQSIQSHSLQDTGDGTVPYAQRLADVPIGPSLLAQFDNPLLALVINGMGARRVTEQAIRSLLAISSEPLVSGAGTDPGSVSGLFNAQALLKELASDAPLGTLDVSFYRDDFSEKGLHPQCRPTVIPFDVEGRHIILVDDVLYTGRTTRAAINELFDYGRPAAVELAVLADRGGRELPVAATYGIWDVALDDGQSLVLERKDDAQLAWRLEHA